MGPFSDEPTPQAVVCISYFWVIVDRLTSKPIVPNDCNPGSNDEGMLVYRSKAAAKRSSDRQNEMYELDTVAMRMDDSKIDFSL